MKFGAKLLQRFIDNSENGAARTWTPGLLFGFQSAKAKQDRICVCAEKIHQPTIFSTLRDVSAGRIGTEEAGDSIYGLNEVCEDPWASGGRRWKAKAAIWRVDGIK